MRFRCLQSFSLSTDTRSSLEAVGRRLICKLTIGVSLDFLRKWLIRAVSLDTHSIFAYAAPIIFVIAFVGWKAMHRKRWVDSMDAQLFAGLEEIEQHEEELAMLGQDKEIGNKWYHSIGRWLF
jgi:amino acid permease